MAAGASVSKFDSNCMANIQADAYMGIITGSGLAPGVGG